MTHRQRQPFKTKNEVSRHIEMPKYFNISSQNHIKDSSNGQRMEEYFTDDNLLKMFFRRNGNGEDREAIALEAELEGKNTNGVIYGPQDLKKKNKGNKSKKGKMHDSDSEWTDTYEVKREVGCIMSEIHQKKVQKSHSDINRRILDDIVEGEEDSSSCSSDTYSERKHQYRNMNFGGNQGNRRQTIENPGNRSSTGKGVSSSSSEEPYFLKYKKINPFASSSNSSPSDIQI